MIKSLRIFLITIFATISLSSCSEIIGALKTGTPIGGAAAPFLAPLIYLINFTSYALGADTGYTLKTKMTAGQREIHSAEISIPGEYTFNGFDKFGAGAKIGAYGFDFSGDDSIDRYLPIFAVNRDLAYVDSNLNGTYESDIEPRIEHQMGSGGGIWIAITAPFGGDADQTTATAQFSSNIAAGFRTGILTNPTTAGNHVITSDITSIDPDNDNENDNAGDPPIVLNAITNVPIRPDTVFASALPLFRNLSFDTTSTHFASILNAGTLSATNCQIMLASPLPAHLDYTPTDPATNLPNGPMNTPVDIAPGTSQSFVVAIKGQKEFLGAAQQSFPDGQVEFLYECDNNVAASAFPGINTFGLSYANDPQTDIIPTLQEPSGTAILTIDPNTRTAAMAAAAVNIGAADPHITVKPRLSMAYSKLTLSICDTTGQAGGACIDPPAPQIMMPYGAGQSSTYSIFFVADADQPAIPLDPLNSRVFLDFTDDLGKIRGSTSVALTYNPGF